MDSIRNQTVLIVDDNRISRRITSALLLSLGITVLEAKDGFEAVDIAIHENVTVIFMNLYLPGMSGFETTSEIKEEKDVPIIAITSEQEETLTDEMIEVGFTSVLNKPLQKEKVLKLLTKLSEKKESLPIFDYEHYKKTFKDVELQKDIIDTFLSEEESDTKRIKEAFKTNDKDEIYSAVHYMKGSFSYLKATRILVLTQSILDRLKLDDLEYAMIHKDEFIKQYQELVRELKKV